MALINQFQVGVKDESTYGTEVVVDRFFEAFGSGLKPDHRRIESRNMRAGTRVLRRDRFAVWKAGARGDITLEPLSKGFAWWLKHMLGSSSTGTVSDSAYTHTGTIGDLRSKSFTYQDNRPFFPADTNQAYTFFGCKIPSWDLMCNAGGLLEFRATIDAQDYDTSTSLASASYPTGTVEPFSFVGASISIDGSSYAYADSVKVSCDNALRTDDYRLRSSGLKLEQLENDFRAISWELSADFDSLTQANRFYSATAAGAYCTVVATFEAPTLIGSSSKPQIILTIDNARFDDAENGVSGPNPLKQRLSGKGLFDGTDSALTVAVVNADATA